MDDEFFNDSETSEEEESSGLKGSGIPRDDSAWVGITTKKGNDGLTYTFDEKGDVICGAKNRRGGPCRKKPMANRNRCRNHGGASPRGLAHPRSVHLKYSKDILGKALAERYERAVKDESLLELRDEIAIIQARIADILKNVESGDTHASFLELKRQYEYFVQANRAGNAEQAADAANKMGRIISKGLGQHVAWRELTEMMGVEKRLIESERKRLLDTKQMMTAEQAMSMLTFIVSVFKKRTYEIVVGNKANELLAAVSKDISEYIGTTKHMQNTTKGG